MPEDREQPWEPAPIPAEEFHRPDEWANINRAPYDEVSGVIYKRAAHIKRVAYAQGDQAEDVPASLEGHGETVVRWLFSEQLGTEEHLLGGATFAFLHDVTLTADTSTDTRAYAEERVLYVMEGRGQLHHRCDASSPIVARPLRPGDAALIRAREYYRIANPSEETLRLLILGLTHDRS